MLTVGAALIARNSADTIGNCLKSLIGNFDQIVVVLAGESKDKTEEVVRSFKEVEVYKFDWIDDFSAARNYSFSFLKTDWNFWCDADDVVLGADRIRGIAQNIDNSVGAIWFPYHYAHDEFNNPTTIYERERLVRSRVGWVWKGRIHETLSPLSESKYVRSDDVITRHNHTAVSDRNERNFKLLFKMLDEDPNDRRIWLYLGHQHFANQNWTEASEWYLKFGQDTQALPVERFQALCYCSKALREMHDKQAIDVALSAVELYPNYKDGYLELAHSYQMIGDFDKVIHHCAMSDVKELIHEPPRLIFVNPLEYTFNKYVLLSNAYRGKGDVKNAKTYMEEAYKVRPLKEIENDIRYLSELERKERVADSVRILATELLDKSELNKLSKLPEIAPFWFKDTPEFSQLKGKIEMFTKDITEQSLSQQTGVNSVLINIANIAEPQKTLDELDKKYRYVTVICPFPIENKKQAFVYSQRDMEELIYNGNRRVLNLQKDSNRIICEYDNQQPNNIKIRMYVGQGLEYWSPRTINDIGCGGSETSAAWLMREFAKKDCYPILYGMDSQVWDGVVYRHYSTYNSQTTDSHLFISSRTPQIFNDDITALQKWLWVHDICCWDRLTPEIADRIDCIITLSHWHVNFLKRVYPWLKECEVIDMDNNPVPYDDLWWMGQTYYPEGKLKKLPKIAIIGDAIETNKYKKLTEKRIKHRFAWCSSPDRGLEELLNLWKPLKEKLPDATLKIYYGWEYFNHSLNMLEQRQFKQRILKLLRQNGVEWCGRIGQDKLAKELQKTDCILYPPPHQFRETYGIAFLEAQAAGVICFYRMNGALGETIGDRGIPLQMDMSQKDIVDKVVETLGDNNLCEKLRIESRKYALQRSWAKQANKFLNLYDKLTTH